MDPCRCRGLSSQISCTFVWAKWTLTWERFARPPRSNHWKRYQLSLVTGEPESPFSMSARLLHWLKRSEQIKFLMFTIICFSDFSFTYVQQKHISPIKPEQWNKGQIKYSNWRVFKAELIIHLHIWVRICIIFAEFVFCAIYLVFSGGILHWSCRGLKNFSIKYDTLCITGLNYNIFNQLQLINVTDVLQIRKIT